MVKNRSKIREALVNFAVAAGCIVGANNHAQAAEAQTPCDSFLPTSSSAEKSPGARLREWMTTFSSAQTGHLISSCDRQQAGALLTEISNKDGFQFLKPYIDKAATGTLTEDDMNALRKKLEEKEDLLPLKIAAGSLLILGVMYVMHRGYGKMPENTSLYDEKNVGGPSGYPD